MAGYTGWTPIVNFGGTFNGDGFAVENLQIASPVSSDGNEPIGLFGSTDAAHIQNLILQNISVNGSNTPSENAEAGILVAMVSASGTMQQITAEGGWCERFCPKRRKRVFTLRLAVDWWERMRPDVDGRITCFAPKNWYF